MGKKMPVILDNLFRKARQPSESPSSSPHESHLFSDGYQKYRDQEDIESCSTSFESRSSPLKDSILVSETGPSSNGSLQLQRPAPRWGRKLRRLSNLIRTIPSQPDSKFEEQSSSGIVYLEPALSWRSKIARCLVYLCLLFFVMLGVIKSVGLLVGATTAFFPDYLDSVLYSWGEAGGPTGNYSHWPTDFSRDIQPVPCHSHNDYWRKVPLFSALKAGCTGVEADVWLYDEELYVGHTTSSLTPKRTLRSLYIDPLIDILTKQNPSNQFHPQLRSPPAGVFDTDPSQSLVFLIDFKTSGRELWPVVFSQLEPLRSKGYLTYYDGKDVKQGPITIVATGNAPFDLLTANTTYRDIFFDAPLDLMIDPASNPNNPLSTQDPFPVSPSSIHTRASSHNGGQGHTALPSNLSSSAFNPTNSYYASVSFKKSIGLLIPLPWSRRTSSLSDEQLQLIRDQIRGAHSRGLQARYWGTPSWPRGLRDHVWRVLLEEGVDMLNVDDLAAATGRGRKGAGWW